MHKDTSGKVVIVSILNLILFALSGILVYLADSYLGGSKTSGKFYFVVGYVFAILIPPLQSYVYYVVSDKGSN